MYEREKKIIYTLSDYADGLQRERLRSFSVESKDGRDVVTDVDRQIENFCIDLIKESFPNDGIISEETLGYINLPKSGRYWIIDPLDGTWNYADGIPSFAFQIAFVIDGEATLSAVNIPFGLYGRETYFAEKGNGAYLNGKRICARNQTRLNRAVIAVSDFSWNKDCALKETKVLNSIVNDIGRIRLFGSSAVSFALLASGRIDAYLGFDQKIWDILPGLLLAREAGCTVRGIDGKPYIAGEKDFISAPSNSVIENRLLKL